MFCTVRTDDLIDKSNLHGDLLLVDTGVAHPRYIYIYNQILVTGVPISRIYINYAAFLYTH